MVQFVLNSKLVNTSTIYLGLSGSSKHMRVSSVYFIARKRLSLFGAHFVFFCSSLLVDYKYTRETQWVRWIFTQIFDSLTSWTLKRLNELWTWKIIQLKVNEQSSLFVEGDSDVFPLKILNWCITWQVYWIKSRCANPLIYLFGSVRCLHTKLESLEFGFWRFCYRRAFYHWSLFWHSSIACVASVVRKPQVETNDQHPSQASS